MDSLDFVWFGMKLGVAMIGMVMMRFLWRGLWRSKTRRGTQGKVSHAGTIPGAIETQTSGNR